MSILAEKLSKLAQSSSTPARRNRISVTDIRRWGDYVSSKTPTYHDTRPFYIVKLPENTEITGENGKVIRTTSKDNPIAFVGAKTGEMGVGKKQDFLIMFEKFIPSLSDINEWNEREKNLTPEDRRLINDYVKRDVSYDERSFQMQEEAKADLYKKLIKNRDKLIRAIEDEKQYQAKSPEEKLMYNTKQKLYRREQHRQAAVTRGL